MTSTALRRPFPSLRITRCLAACLVFFVAAQLSALPLQEPQSQPVPAAQQTQSQPAAADSSSATQIAELPQAPEPAQQETQQPGSQQPLGTAAGPATNPTGVAGTRPAGAAIAPAKQRRVRAFLIKFSLVVAAVAAAGTVVALSNASPSRPSAMQTQ